MKVFYHNDNDGKAAAAMIYLHHKYTSSISESDFYEVDYNTRVPNVDIINEGEVVYIVDYSFTFNTIDILRSLKTKTDKIVWLDHHESSLEVLDLVESEKLTMYNEIDIKRCGAMIVYDEYIKYTNLDNSNIQYIICLVDDYDRWIHNYKESILFNIGSIVYDTHPTSSFWHTDPEFVIDNGAVLKEYKDITNKSICDRYSYTCAINGLKCIVLNTPESSSQVFVEYYDKYDIAIRYEFNGDNYLYSIYSNKINCAKLSKAINPKGGGHKGAAGFVSSKVEFLPDREYYIPLN